MRADGYTKLIKLSRCRGIIISNTSITSNASIVGNTSIISIECACVPPSPAQAPEARRERQESAAATPGLNIGYFIENMHGKLFKEIMQVVRFIR